MLTATPHITVGLPVYNDPDGLRRTVPNVFGQTWEGPLRLLIVDDGSSDETRDLLSDYSRIFDGLEVVDHPKSPGWSVAANEVLRRTEDGYLAWINPGDLWHPRKLELQISALLAEEENSAETALLCVSTLRWYSFEGNKELVRVPETDGDQLYSALTGTLTPYLQGVVGRAESFRRVGGFDERLARFQDYDFLVRFVADGGKVVTTPAHLPLYTYIEADEASSASTVALSNRVIRRKHRVYSQLYGRKLTGDLRKKQHLLVADLFERSGASRRSRWYRTRARVSKSYQVLLAAIVRRVKIILAATMRGVVAVAARVLKPVLPLLRKAGAIKILRRLGLAHLLARTGAMRSYYGAIKPVAPNSGSANPESLEDGEQVEPANPVPTARSTGLSVAEECRDKGLRYSALAALDRVLEEYPGDPELLVRKLELLPLRNRWQECVQMWAELPPEAEPYFTEASYKAVAQSFRLLGDAKSALDVALVGVNRWPEDTGLRYEVSTNRASLVDWREALIRPSLPIYEHDEAREVDGVVTDLGFLVGQAGPLKGWLLTSSGQLPRVSLSVNGTIVATTYAARSAADDDRREFALNCHGLMRFLGDGDVIIVTSSGERLRLAEGGFRGVVITGYESQFRQVRRRIKNGWVFTKFGALKRGNTLESKRELLAFYDEVASVLERSLDLASFPFYGNLLGAVRDSDVIGHDVGGFDMGYVSNHHDAKLVKAEFMDACKSLAESGFFLGVMPWGAYVRSNRYEGHMIDLNFGWFNDTGELQLSYGWRYSPVVDQARFRQRRYAHIAGHSVLVPGNAEQVLEQIYGPTWAIPDQGFELNVALKRDWSYLLSLSEMTELEAHDPDRLWARTDGYPFDGG